MQSSDLRAFGRLVVKDASHGPKVKAVPATVFPATSPVTAGGGRG